MIFSVPFVDISGLKVFNETARRTVVDQLIIHISNRLKAHLRHEDTIARSTPTGGLGRLAGDETLARMDSDQFTLLLEGIKRPSDPMRVAVRIQKCLSALFTARGIDVFASASIGIALSSPSYHQPEEMLRDADIGMRRAKALGACGREVFDAQMHALVVQRLKLESELRKAIEREEFRVYCQPKRPAGHWPDRGCRVASPLVTQ